jgi:hypothetical protein
MPNNQPPRGTESVARFAQHMLQTLNLPKNTCKRHWNSLSLVNLRFLMVEEYIETFREIVKTQRATTPLQKAQAAQRLAEEAVDLANTAMMLYDYAQELIQNAQNMQKDNNHAQD